MKLRSAVVGGILGTSLLSGGWLLGRGLTGRESGYSSSRLFDDVATHIKRYYVDSVSDSVLMEKATVGMLQELGDPYTLYLPPDRVRRLTETTTGNYFGIGANVQRRDNWPTVVTPFPGSPAERAGLHMGDRIVQIDGKPTHGWTVDEANKALRGPPETSVTLVIDRPGSPKQVSFTLVRGDIHRPAISRSLLLEQSVGFVALNNFNDSTEDELRRAVDSLSRAGMRSLILDLRGNPGGVLAQGASVADMFLMRGQLIVTVRGRTPDTNQSILATAAQRWPTLPLVVLIDDGSASAAEIVAGALQDHDRAVLIGHTSYGKGSAQSVFQVSSGGAVKLTTARWFTPSGRSIDRPHLTEDGSSLEDSTKAKTYRTEHGRTVYGRGGITPDITAGDTALSPSEHALDNALGTRVLAFRDAMTAYALRLKTQGAVKSRDFVVTPQMLDGLWATMRARGFSFDRKIFDAASELVSRLLAREIAHYVFGSEAEAERAVRGDPVAMTAWRLAAGVTSTDQLLERTRQRAPSSRAH